jgi:UDP-glucose 4,6-dehydratase
VLFHGRVGEIYNVGTKDEISVLEVAKALLKCYGLDKKGEDWLEFVADRHFNDQRYYISTSKLEALGWKPKLAFQGDETG